MSCSRCQDEIHVDLFAGGGGASLGFYMATGKHIDVAVNHDIQAVALHAENHPETKHYIEDVFEVDPVAVCNGRPVGMLWLSPDCKHFSKAKGGKPLSCNTRSLAWVGVRWARMVRPRVIILENVEEFKTWGPLDENGSPIKSREGETFKKYIEQYEAEGYTVEYKELVASDYGAPTIRKRLFMIARCDGRPIIWPEPTHGDPKLYPHREPWRTAGECIDWSIPSYSIFMSKEEGKKHGVRRPLAEKTLVRIAKGIRKFVIENPNPYLVEKKSGCTTHLTKTLVAAFVAQHNLGNVGRMPTTPMSTITATGSQQQLVTVEAGLVKDTEKALGYVMKMRRGSVGFPDNSPAHTITAGGGHFAQVNVFIMKYSGSGGGSSVDELAHTVTTKERFAVIEIAGLQYVILDVCMRMFTPRELYRAQGFPDSYKIEIEFNGKKLPKTAQVRMCGNSVPPPVASAIIKSNLGV